MQDMQDHPVGSSELGSFGTQINAVIVGASGGIGNALANHLDQCHAVSKLFRLSRSGPRSEHTKGPWLHVDFENEETIAKAAIDLERVAGELQLVIVATGILYDGDRVQPEKTWRSLTGPAMESAFRINAIGPALVAKHFLPLLAKDGKSAFAVLSARVGSIEDNRLGGWYAFRAFFLGRCSSARTSAASWRWFSWLLSLLISRWTAVWDPR